MSNSGRIHRSKKNRDFVDLDTHALRNQSLSLKAKGLHSYLMQLPIDWQINIADLQTRSTDGRDGVTSGMKELIAAGYVVRRRVTNSLHQFVGYEYFVYERPEYANPENGISENGFSETGFSEIGKSVTTKNEKKLRIKRTKGAPTGAAADPTEEKPKPIIHQMVEVFEVHHKKHFSPDGQWVGYEWREKDFGQLQNLRKILVERWKKRNAGVEPSQEQLLEVFDAFLSRTAEADQWYVTSSFTPAGLYSNFQNIVNRVNAPSPAANASHTGKPFGDPANPGPGIVFGPEGQPRLAVPWNKKNN
jgi:hypothetical protein